jgi:predicted DNA-binding antitoxin AbrB/MazE fold protein
MSTIQAIYENGVFRPLVPVELPEMVQVEFEPRIVDTKLASERQQRVYSILGQSFDTDQPDLATRHDEHQP